MISPEFEAQRAALQAVLEGQLVESECDFDALRDTLADLGEVGQEEVELLDYALRERSRLTRRLAFVREVLADEAVQELLMLLSCAGWARVCEQQRGARQRGARQSVKAEVA